MSELVLLHHNEPMTTSETLADGVEMPHKSVLQLLRKYVEDLREWGGVAFEMRPLATEGGNQWREVAYLNEGQAMFLLTLMRNTPVVVAFKKALVKAFLELRARVTAVPALTGAVDHRADVMVLADRTFRAILRSARAAGLRLPQALGRANDIARRETGVDMLAELGPLPEPVAAPMRADPVADALAAWMKTAGPGPWSMETIVAEAFGIGRKHPNWMRHAAAAGPVLRSAGFVRRRVLTDGGQPALWERPAA
jgi:phage regulator Rha-like protein